MRTGTRCAILVKLPVALSVLITLNSEPAAGEKRSIWPFSSRVLQRIDREA